ncbi:MAG: hypothetical protein ACYS47_02340 [Planctomycetota bacterium]|jgi:hypothetical protein
MIRLCIMAALFAAAAQASMGIEGGKRTDMVTQVYDVGFLTRAVKDHGFKPLGLIPPPDVEAEEVDEEQETGAMEVGTVMAMMQGLTSDWDEPASIQNTETYIVVVHTVEVQRRMEALLETLKRKRSTTVTCTLRVYAVGGPTGLAGGGVFSEKEGDALTARLGSNPNLRLVKAWTLTGFNGQQVAGWDGKEQTFLRDYDAQVAQESAMADPVIATIREGVSFSLRSTVTEPSTVLLDIKTTLAKLEGEVQGHQYNAEKLGTLEKPLIRIQTFETSLLLPDGGVAVIGSFDRAKPAPTKAGEKDPASPEERFLVVVKARIRVAFK